MNKVEFLKRLEKELSVLEADERKEIIRFYEERFHTGVIYENKTEEEVVYELESPDVIARNVLEEYGVSPKYVKTKEDRYTGINPMQLIVLIAFDLIIATWLIPTLFSVSIALLGSVVSWFGFVPVMFGERTVLDEFTFAFATGTYVLLFLFGLLLLEVSIGITKRIVFWHMNVLKLRKREKFAKKLSKVSVEGYFKRHKRLANLRTFLFVGALVTVLYSGYHLFVGENNVFEVYGNQTVETVEYTLDVEDDITNSVAWDIVTNFDVMHVDIQPTTGTEIVVTHKYTEEYDFQLTFNEDDNVLTISNDYPQIIWFTAENVFNWFAPAETVVIEVPQTLLLGGLDINAVTGEIGVQDLTMDELNILSTTADVTVYDVSLLTGDLIVELTTGDVIVKRVLNLSGESNIAIDATTGDFIVEDVAFLHYTFLTTTGDISLSSFNVQNQDGVELDINVTTGDISLEDVYVSDVAIHGVTSDISFYNSDTTYDVEQYTKSTVTGDVTGNVN